MNLKHRNLLVVFFFTLIVCFSADVFANSKEALCDCKKIIETKVCDNPDCIKICSILYPLSDLKNQLIDMCLGKDNKSFNFKENNVSATKIEFVTKEAKKKIIELENKGKQILKRNCPDCHLVPKVSAVFKVDSKEKNCPDKYLKTYHYKSSKTIDIKDKECDKTEIFSYFGNYIQSLVKGNTETSKQLWKACPDPCSFEVSYTVKIDNKCKGDLQAQVDCTHRVDKSLFGIPIYDIKINYEGDLKCEKSR